MGNLQKIVYLTEAQAQTLFSNGTITVNGVTVTYSADDLYVTPTGDVVDVQVNGTSIVSNGVANIPYAQGSRFGVVRYYSGYGIDGNSNGIYVTNASSAQIKAATETRNSINPVRQHESTFYGLAKAAGDSTQSASSNAVGVYTETAKQKINAMFGIGEATEIRAYTELGLDMSLIEIPLPERYTKVVFRFYARINNSANDLANGEANVLIWLGDSSTFGNFEQYNSIYTKIYIRQSDKYMNKGMFIVNFPFIERIGMDPYGATNWSAGQAIKWYGGSYASTTDKLSSYPQSLFIRPYETNNGYLFKSDSLLDVYVV